MISHVVPDRFFEGQVLWCEIEKNNTPILLLCRVLTVKPDKCEIKFLNSDDTCIWVEKKDLAEIRQRVSR